jgi:hypothetical protein
MFKKSLLLGVTSGVLAGIVAVVYARVYYSTNEADFSEVASNVRIISASLFGGVLAAIGYYALDRWLKGKGEIIFNFAFTTISFVSLVIPITARLKGVDTPEFFPGMAIPMHLFPALGWYTLKPLFIRK